MYDEEELIIVLTRLSQEEHPRFLNGSTECLVSAAGLNVLLEDCKKSGAITRWRGRWLARTS